MGYEKPNYTQTPNLFLDEHLPEMSGSETKIVLAIIRQTFGWHKEKDRLSISQLMEMTGLSNRTVIDATQSAIDRGVIDREEAGSSYRYWLVVGCEKSSQGGVKKSHKGCERSSQEGVKKSHTQKKQKETLSKETGAPPDDEDDDPKEGSTTIRDDDPRGVQVWVEETGERPSLSLRSALGRIFSGDLAFDEDTFREVVRDTVLDMDDPSRARPSIFRDQYKRKLEQSGGGLGVTEDGRIKGQQTKQEYNARGYPIQSPNQ